MYHDDMHVKTCIINIVLNTIQNTNTITFKIPIVIYTHINYIVLYQRLLQFLAN